MKFLLVIFFIMLSLGQVQAQDVFSCKVNGAMDSFFIVEIDGKQYRAMPPELFDQLKNSCRRDIEEQTARAEAFKQQAISYKRKLDEYETLRRQYQALIAEHERALTDSVALNERYKENLVKLVALTEKYDKLAREFDDLAGRYRSIAVDRHAYITLDLGVGATGNDGDFDAAGLVGMGVSWFKVWGFYQNDNSGLLVGTSFKF